jgi:hypothetical protein
VDNYNLVKLSSQAVTTNLAPVVSAGSDQTVALRSGTSATHTVVSGSTRDPDGTIKSVAWTKKSGPAAFMTGTKTPTLVVSELAAGTYVFAMSATDSKNITSSDEVKVVVSAAAAQTVSSFTLINADTDQPIKTLVNGETINLAALPTKNLNLSANTSPATVGSVRFVLNGVAKNESIRPYAWAGDNNGNLNPWTPPNGTYTLTVTAYSGSNGGGLAGKPVQVSFTVTGNAAARLAAEGLDESFLKAYPNPVVDKLHLQLLEPAGPVRVQLFDPLGRLHYQQVLQPGDGKRVVDLTGLPKGLYVVRAESGGNTYRVKVRKE